MALRAASMPRNSTKSSFRSCIDSFGATSTSCSSRLRIRSAPSILIDREGPLTQPYFAQHDQGERTLSDPMVSRSAGTSWCSIRKRSASVDLAERIWEHLTPIANALDHRLSNAIVEGLNTRLRLT